jgi:hypothetical protein
MKKKFLAIFLAICTVCSSIATAQEDSVFDIIKYDFNIFCNGNKMKFDSPVLLINGQTYVPLRDFAEAADMNVQWDDVTKEITLTYRNLDTESTFERLFEFYLPQSAEIINYAYAFDCPEERFVAKIFFEESDLEYVKKELNNIAWDIDLEGYEDELTATVLNNLSKTYSWWDLSSTEDIQYAYFGLKAGVEDTTISILGFICKADDADGYYLYIKH